MNLKGSTMQTYTLPTNRVRFDHKIRKAWLTVDAEAWGDMDGIYKVAIVNVWLDTAEVFDLLTPEDIADIESAIEPAIREDQAEEASTTINPFRDAFIIGE